MSGVTPSSTSRGLVICTGIYLAFASFYSALYSPPAWMWFGWCVMAIATVILVVTDRPT